MKFSKICIILLLLIISIGAVSATEVDNSTVGITQDNQYMNSESDYTFMNLTNEIDISGGTLDIQHDYKFNNESDAGYITIDKNDFTINGNGFTIDGNKQSGIFNITGTNVTINDLVIINGKSDRGIIDSTGEITLNNVTFILNNVTFISDHTKYVGGAISNRGGKINCYGSKFIDNHAESGAAIFIENGELNVCNTYITSSISNRYGQVWARYSTVNIDNVDFINISAMYSPAISLEYCSDTIITNSSFINLTADMSAGAISLKRQGNLYIKGCDFINTKSSKNAGALIADYILADNINVTILDSLFYNASSLYGGAFIQLSGNLVLNNTRFINNKATYGGGALYLSYVNSEINGCTFDSNVVEELEDNPCCGGALYFDCADLVIRDSQFTNNSASLGNAIYLCDSNYKIVGSTFVNNTNAIYSDFDKEFILDETNNFNNDTIIHAVYEYQKYVDSPQWEFNLVNNTITVTNIPSRFDAREWGWVTSVKHQGHMGACWTFGTIATLESAILKSYGVELNLSEGNLFHNMLRYFIYGATDATEGGFCSRSASYLLGWYGPVLEENDVYDEVGKLSPYTTIDYDVYHVQDVIFIPYDDMPNGTKIKEAILKYGPLAGYYYAEYGTEGYYNVNKSSQYTYDDIQSNHCISIVGWDDNYSKDNFLVTPPDDGAWIIKNSWGTLYGDEGYLYVSYYDKSFVESTNVNNHAMAIITDNTVSYNKNYQHDFTWEGNFQNPGQAVEYANKFVAAEDDLIAAVGTYFNSGGVNYTVRIFVNDELKLVQEGISPYCGFHTIKLDSYVPIKEGDVFLAAVTSNLLPYAEYSDTRVHYGEGLSFAMFGGEWIDLSDANLVACVKAYTVPDDTKIVDNNDISVDYNGGKYFSVKVVTADGHAVGAGEAVKFTINGKTTTVKTDKNGIAKIKITDVPKTYTIKTTYKGKTYTNKVTVKQVLTTSKVTVKKTAKSFTLKATLKINGKLVKGKTIKFKLNGKTYKATTNSKGVAKVTLKKNVINKLKKGKTYTVQVTYLKDTIKTTLKVQ